MDKKALIKLVLGLSASNTIMMAAWYILLPVDLPILLAILPSWAIACVEYVFHVSANRATHDRLGLIRLRGANEIINFLAFLLICVIAHQTLYWKYGVAVVLVAVVVYLFLLSESKPKQWLVFTGIVVLSLCIFAAIELHAPSVPGKITQGFQPILPGGLPLILFGGCFIANSFMLLAWYTHLHIKQPPLWFRKTAWKRWLFSWGISCAIALLEYSVLIPINRLSYKFVSIIALFGYMEISTVTVFLIGAAVARNKYAKDPFKLNKVHSIGFVLLILIEASFCIF